MAQNLDKEPKKQLIHEILGSTSTRNTSAIHTSHYNGPMGCSLVAALGMCGIYAARWAFGSGTVVKRIQGSALRDLGSSEARGLGSYFVQDSPQLDVGFWMTWRAGFTGPA